MTSGKFLNAVFLLNSTDLNIYLDQIAVRKGSGL